MKQWTGKIAVLFIALILPMVGFGIVGYSASNGETKIGNFVMEGQIPYVEARKSAASTGALSAGEVRISGWDNACDTPVVITYTDKTAESIQAFFINVYMEKDGAVLAGENIKFYRDGAEVGTMKRNKKAFQFMVGPSTETVKFTVQDGEGNEKQGEIRFVLKDYTVNVVTPESGGKVSVDKTEAPVGEEITLTAEPELGWKLKSWKVTEAAESGQEISVSPNGNTAKFIMPKGGVNVTAEFERKAPDFVVEGQIPYVEARKSAASTGALSAGEVKLSGWDNDCSTPVIVTYTDKTITNFDKAFFINIYMEKDGAALVAENVKFYRDGSEVGTMKRNKKAFQFMVGPSAETIKFTVQDEGGNEKQGEIRFVLKDPSHTINIVNPSAGGTLSADKTEASEDEEVILTAEPETGWKLKSWNVTAESGKKVMVTAEGNTAKFTMPGESVNVTAEFEKLSNQAVLTGVQLLDSEGNIVANGTVSGEKAFEIQLSKDTESDTVQYLYMKLTYSEKATVKMLPSGYDDATSSNGTWASGKIMCNMEADHPTEFQVTAEDGTAEVYTITIKSDKEDVKPEKFYEIAVSTPAGGSLTVAKTKAAEGEKIKVTAVPDAGYEMETGSLRYSEAVNGGAVVPIDETAMEFTMPAVGVTVTCTWKKASGQTPEPGGNKPSVGTCMVGGVNCAVNNTEQLITVMLPYGTDVKALKIEYTASNIRSASPESGQTADFSSPVPLTLEGTDGSVAVYTVQVTVQEANPSERLWEQLSDTSAHTPWWKQAERQKNRGNYPNSWGE